MSAATIVSLPDRQACRRLADLVAQLDGLARRLRAGEDVSERLQGLQDRVMQLAEDVQAQMPWIQRHAAPRLVGRWHTRTRRAIGGAAVLLWLCWPASAVAQGVSDPTTVTFIPSADHDVLLEGGTPAVTRYELRLYYLGASQPWSVHDLGKDTPNQAGEIVHINPAWFIPAAANEPCEARVAAIGPQGEGLSDPSNEFYSTTGQPPEAVTITGLVSRRL